MNTYQRIDRISEEVRREVDAIIREELGDPRIEKSDTGATAGENPRDAPVIAR